ncbi:MAG: winged helix-turn-helix transcriptional regulator [Candidatus Helarchaeota archaeon]
MKKNEKNKNLLEIEKKVIKELVENPRISITHLSKKIKKTRTTTSKIFKNLFKANYIYINTGINVNYLDIKLYLVKIHLKCLKDMIKYSNYFQKCPKFILSFESVSTNELFVIIWDNVKNFQNKNYFPCKCIIDKIQGEPNVLECKIVSEINYISPIFVNNIISSKSKTNSDNFCKKVCFFCKFYNNCCNGCPNSILLFYNHRLI